MKRHIKALLTLAVACAATLGGGATSHANPPLFDLPKPTIPDARFAPIDRPGPQLRPSPQQLQQSLHCVGVGKDTSSGSQKTVLFVHGTLANPQDYAATWLKQLNATGRPHCYVSIPGNAAGDTQINGQYVVNAIRETYRRSGQKIQILGHSQGGLLPRYALRFWPDTRHMVDDVISFAATNHGSSAVSATICAIACAPGVKQQEINSAFVQATNSYQETFKGISYTQIYTTADQFVQPNLDSGGTSSLHSGDGNITNVALQDVCPGWVAEHLMIGLSDPIAYALAIDALNHDGPADPHRIEHTVCSKKTMPAVPDSGKAMQNLADVTLNIMRGLTGPGVRVTEEPKLFAYSYS